MMVADMKTNHKNPKSRPRKPTPLNRRIRFYFSEVPQLEFAYYGSGFLEAARSLVRRLRRQRGFRNVEPLPVLFLYRHAIELYLKAIIVRGDVIMSESEDPLADTSFFKNNLGHHLLPLLTRVESVFRYVGWEWYWPINPEVKTLSNVRALLRFLEKIDPLATGFRYPVDKQGRRLVAKDVEISFGSFVSALDGLAESLETADFGLAAEYSR